MNFDLSIAVYDASHAEALTALGCEIHEYFYSVRGEPIIHTTKRK